MVKIAEDQALDLLRGAVEDYHERHKHATGLDELLQLLQKCNLRVKGCADFLAGHTVVLDTGPVDALNRFAVDVKRYLRDVNEEIKCAEEAEKAWRFLKKEYQDLLVQLPPSAVFPLDPKDHQGKVVLV